MSHMKNLCQSLFLYDKTLPCPSAKKSNFEAKPWITKGLQNAIKKKNLKRKT